MWCISAHQLFLRGNNCCFKKARPKQCPTGSVEQCRPQPTLGQSLETFWSIPLGFFCLFHLVDTKRMEDVPKLKAWVCPWFFSMVWFDQDQVSSRQNRPTNSIDQSRNTPNLETLPTKHAKTALQISPSWCVSLFRPCKKQPAKHVEGLTKHQASQIMVCYVELTNMLVHVNPCRYIERFGGYSEVWDVVATSGFWNDILNCAFEIVIHRIKGTEVKLPTYGKMQPGQSDESAGRKSEDRSEKRRVRRKKIARHVRKSRDTAFVPKCALRCGLWWAVVHTTNYNVTNKFDMTFFFTSS